MIKVGVEEVLRVVKKVAKKKARGSGAPTMSPREIALDLRGYLGISAPEMGILMGTVPEVIYRVEAGRVNPRAHILARMVEARKRMEPFPEEMNVEDRFDLLASWRKRLRRKYPAVETGGDDGRRKNLLDRTAQRV